MPYNNEAQECMRALGLFLGLLKVFQQLIKGIVELGVGQSTLPSYFSG
jgi:hypothetical protein